MMKFNLNRSRHPISPIISKILSPVSTNKMSPTIGVFPASGGLGTSIVNHLAKLVPASQLVLIARDPKNLTSFKNEGATVRRADYDEPSTFPPAFEGVDILMLISYASFEIDHRIQVSTSFLVKQKQKKKKKKKTKKSRPTATPSTPQSQPASNPSSTRPSASAET